MYKKGIKLKKQTKYFLIGLFFLIIAMFCITLFPIIIKKYTTLKLENYVFVQTELLFLIITSIFLGSVFINLTIFLLTHQKPLLCAVSSE